MTLFILKKLQNRKYDSEDLLRKVLLLSGREDCLVFREENGRLGVRSAGGGIPLYVSVSHTGRYWVCLTDSAGPVGVDIEERRRKVGPGVQRALHPLEREYLSGMESASGDWRAAFLDLWTRKESYVKFLGTGLARGFSSFSVIEATGVPARSIQEEEGTVAYFSSPAVSDDLQLALCASRPVDAVDIRSMEDPGRPLKSASEQAADYLSARDYTARELRGKLIRKGHDPQEAGRTVAQFSQTGYLDDGRYAENYVQRAFLQGKGRQRIVLELLRKGVEADLAKALTEAHALEQPESESDRALRQAELLLERSPEYGTGEPISEKTKGRIARRLSALGYEASLIYATLERLRS